MSIGDLIKLVGAVAAIVLPILLFLHSRNVDAAVASVSNRDSSRADLNLMIDTLQEDNKALRARNDYLDSRLDTVTARLSARIDTLSAELDTVKRELFRLQRKYGENGE